MEHWTIDEWIADLDSCADQNLYFEISGYDAGLLRNQINQLRKKNKQLQELVFEAFCEGFQEGKDGGWIVGAEGEPWRKSQSKVKLKEIK